MLAQMTAEIFSAFLYGVAGIIGGGILFESGKRYVKTMGSNQFKGKMAALPFFIMTLLLGWGLQHLDPIVNDIVLSLGPEVRLGIVIVGSMVAFNYTVDDCNVTDEKSVFVYAVGVMLILLPSL